MRLRGTDYGALAQQVEERVRRLLEEEGGRR
jgi:hypothetical protein